MGSVGNMPLARGKARMLCVTVMTLKIFLAMLSWKLWSGGGGGGDQKVLIPSERFWRVQTVSEAFWNREQQRLDLVYSPIFSAASSNGSLVAWPDWLNNTGPSDSCEPDHRPPRQILDYNVLPRRFQDFLLHMRCRTYPMLINRADVCSGTPFLLLAVKSLVPHFDRRQAIRETWGRAGVLANRTVVTVFLLGSASPEDNFPDLRGMLDHEAELHGDLLQWDYRDSFFNLTLKDVLFLDWFSTHCPQARFVLKGDDDVFVNTLRVIELLGDLSQVQARDLFIGDVIRDAGPHRDERFKYFIPESVFVGAYPPYAGGGGYLLSGELAARLSNVSRQVVLYPIDDVFTGMCLQKLGLVPEKHSGFRTFGIEDKFRRNPCIYRSLILVHSRTPQELLEIWTWISNPELDCQ